MSELLNRDGIWYIRWTDATRRRRWRSTKIRTSVDPTGKIAAQVQRDFDTRQAKQIAGIEDSAPPIHDCLVRVIGLKRQASPKWQGESQTRLKRWAAWFSGRGIDNFGQVTPEILEDYIEERRQAVGPKTVKTEIDLLRSAARMANRTLQKPIPVDTWPQVVKVTAERPERIGAYSREEVDRILADLEHPRRNHWYVPVLLLSYLGCRWGELLALTVGDVRLDGQLPAVRFESRKTARNVREQHRWVDVHRRIRPILGKLVTDRKPGEKLLIDPPNIHDARNVLSRCCERLGIQYRRVHGFRHTWITEMLRSGVPMAVVMYMAGHRNLATTQKYTHVTDIDRGWVDRSL